MTRLQTYRAFLAAMSPSSNPRDALEREFYVEPPGGGGLVLADDEARARAGVDTPRARWDRLGQDLRAAAGAQ